MAKDYLCRDCYYNNNGWCKKKKMQGLKQVTHCSEKPRAQQPEEPVFSNEELNDDYGFSYRLLGKRELYWSLQRNIVAIEQDDTIKDKYNEVLKVFGEFGRMLSQIEDLSKNDKILNESMIDIDLRKDSKSMYEYLRSREK